MSYDFKNSKANVEKILNSPNDVSEKDTIPDNDSEFTFSNGVRAWVGALFVDMRDSSSYFTENKPTTVAKVMRAFVSEVIDILRDGENYRDIGIRGDCVYGIYSAPLKSDLVDLFGRAALICSFNKMFQKQLESKGFPTFSIGIGLGSGKDLVIKAGRKGSGINDFIWIGDAVIHASNLSSLGDSQYGYPIYMDSTFMINVKHHKLSDGITLESILHKDYVHGDEVFKCDVVDTAFEKWSKNGYKG